MMNRKVWAVSALFLILLTQVWAVCTIDQPILTYGDNPNEVKLSVVGTTGCDPLPFITLNNINDGTSLQVSTFISKDYSVTITSSTYARTSYVFTTTVIPQTKYSWTASADNNLGPFEFTIRDHIINREIRLIVTADADISSQSMVTFRALANLNLANYDGLIHAGDMAYDIQTNNGTKGDQYFNALSNLITKVPFLPLGGNHELFDGTKLLSYRYRMPNYSDQFLNNIFYKKIHNTLLLFVNYDLFLKIDSTRTYECIRYVEQILKNAADDSSIKWKAVVSHRPIYCGGLAEYDCTINPLMLKAFDDLYVKYKVDVLLQAHEHFFERMKVSRNFQLLKENSPTEVDGVALYKDLPVPLSMISGLAGHATDFKTGQQTNLLNHKFFSQIQSYLELRITDSTFEITSRSSSERKVLDSVRIMKFGTNSDPGSSLEVAFWVFIGVFIILVIGIALGAWKWRVSTKQQGKASEKVNIPKDTSVEDKVMNEMVTPNEAPRTL